MNERQRVANDPLVLKSLVRRACADGRALQVRQERRLSQYDVAQAAGVSHAAVSRWERGLQEPTGPGALRYAKLLIRLGLQDGSPEEADCELSEAATA